MRWRLIWHDTRYLNGTVPAEEAQYILSPPDDAAPNREVHGEGTEMVISPNAELLSETYKRQTMSAIFQYSKIAVQAVLLWTLFAGLGLMAVGGTDFLALLGLAPRHGGSGTTAVLLALLSLLMAIVYFVLANKLVMGFVLSRLLKMKLTQNLRDQLVLRLSAHPQWMNAVDSATNLKTALLQTIDSDSNMHSLLRRVVRNLMGRLNVDQLLGNPDKLQLTHQIADQLIEKAAQTAAPAYSHFVYALLVHTALVWFVM